MTDEKILEMIRDLVKRLDYDLYKEMFVYDNDGDYEREKQELVAIVRKHLD